jgi:hypothetical protein
MAARDRTAERNAVKGQAAAHSAEVGYVCVDVISVVNQLIPPLQKSGMPLRAKSR